MSQRSPRQQRRGSDLPGLPRKTTLLWPVDSATMILIIAITSRQGDARENIHPAPVPDILIGDQPTRHQLAVKYIRGSP